LVAQGRYSEAFDYVRLGIERTGQDRRLLATAEESLTKLYAWYYNQGKFDDALPVIQRFIVFLPNSPKVPGAYALMGDIYLKKGKYIYADTALSYALRTNPHTFEWWLGAGLAREKFGDYKSSLAAYTEALKLDPTNQEALRGRVRVREKLSLTPSPSVS
jgi:tetratricopeptide (TPR) repeat protein